MTDTNASNEPLLIKQARRESSARTYPRTLGLAIKRADGVTVEGMDGETYLDCLAGAGSLALGHNHPVVLEAVQSVLTDERPLHTLDITTPVKEAFVDALFDSLPAEFAANARIQFCGPAGTDAVEAAVKLVKTATGNRSVLAFQGGYHGMTHGALSLTGDTHPKEPVAGLMPDVHHLPFPDPYRCPFGRGGERSARTAAHYVEHVLDDPKAGIVEPAGMIVEPVQGEGGSRPAPDEWLREIRRITSERDIPLIVDEIQTGLGRTGGLYAFEHADITPDAVTLSKAVGGGLPLAVVVYDESLDAWEPGAHAGTFRGHQLAMAAGRATIEYVLANDLHEHAATMGDRLRSHFDSLADLPVVGTVRGRGLMLGVEFVEPTTDAGAPTADGRPAAPNERTEGRPAAPNERTDGRPAANGDFAERVQAECLERGLIVELGGRESATARFLPPLTVTRDQIDDIGARFAESVEAVHNRPEQGVHA